MKTITILLITLCSIVSFSQTENEGDILINKTQRDHTYYAGETFTVNTVVQRYLVIAVGNLIINDSINENLTAVGVECFLNSYIADDFRIAAGRAIIDS
jgi:hypothetical protein